MCTLNIIAGVTIIAIFIIELITFASDTSRKHKNEKDSNENTDNML